LFFIGEHDDHHLSTIIQLKNKIVKTKTDKQYE
jgi:hypothetical protein